MFFAPRDKWGTLYTFLLENYAKENVLNLEKAVYSKMDEFSENFCKFIHFGIDGLPLALVLNILYGDW